MLIKAANVGMYTYYIYVIRYYTTVFVLRYKCLNETLEKSRVYTQKPYTIVERHR